MHAGDGLSMNEHITGVDLDTGTQALQIGAPNNIATMPSFDTHENALVSCNTSASGGSGAVGSVGGKASILRRRGKKKKDYPAAWGEPTDNMTMKKRVLRVYDGPNELLKEDVMFNTAYEVRMQLADGKNHVTALDVETVNRAELVHQYMATNNAERVKGRTRWGASGIEAFASNVEVMKDNKRLLAR